MADYTTNTGITKPIAGEYPNTWGTKANTNFDIFDRALGGRTTITKASGGANVYGVDYPITLAVSDGALSDGQYPAIEYADDGDLGADLYVQLTPSDAKRTITFKNSLTNDRSLVIYQGEYNSGRAYIVPNGYDATLVFSGGESTAATVTALLDKPALTSAHTATLIDLIYPVGSIYIATIATNPGTLFGVGTWESFGSEKMLRGISTGTAGTTGGADSFTLTSVNIPAHAHDKGTIAASTNSTGSHAHYYRRANMAAYATQIKGDSTGTSIRLMYDSTPPYFDALTGNIETTSAGSHSHTVTVTGSTGTYGKSSPTAIDTVSAYITVYMWKRTA